MTVRAMEVFLDVRLSHPFVEEQAAVRVAKTPEGEV